VTEDLSAKLQKAGRNRVVVSHAVGAADDGRLALIKLALFGGTAEVYALPAGLAYSLIDRVAEAIQAGAIKDCRAQAEPGSPEARQLAAYGTMRPEIGRADWDAARGVTEIRAHLFGNALGLQMAAGDVEALLILPDQVAILLHEQLILAATYLIDRVDPPVSRSEH
jgi:hypothetical protein